MTVRDVVLVTGPRLAGSTLLAAALRARLPDRAFVEAADLGPGEAPAAVVFAASAVAPLTASDCALLDAAAADTDLVIGVVSKVDVHRGWREVLATDSEIAAAHDRRYAGLVWVGVAAAPQRGERELDELVDALERGLADPMLRRRNRLRVRQNRLGHGLLCQVQADRDRQSRITALRQERAGVLRRNRRSKSEQTISLRSRIQHARVHAAYVVHSRCASVRGELGDDAATVVCGRAGDFEEHVAVRVGAVVAEVHDAVGEQLAGLAAEFGLSLPQEPPPEPPRVGGPPLGTGQLEARLMWLLGTVLGVGVALTLSRLLADVLRAHTAAGVAAGAAIGLTLGMWVIGVRRTLRDRAVLDRWVADVISELRPALERHVATRVLHVDSALANQLTRRHEAESATAAARVAEIDDELREHARLALAGGRNRGTESFL